MGMCINVQTVGLRADSFRTALCFVILAGEISQQLL